MCGTFYGAASFGPLIQCPVTEPGARRSREIMRGYARLREITREDYEKIMVDVTFIANCVPSIRLRPPDASARPTTRYPDMSNLTLWSTSLPWAQRSPARAHSPSRSLAIGRARCFPGLGRQAPLPPNGISHGGRPHPGPVRPAPAPGD